MAPAWMKQLKNASSKESVQPGQTPRDQLTLVDLPYVNEVDAALVRRPRGSARLLSFMVCALLLSMLIWSSMANIDEVTHAEGHVIASQRTQAIQNLEGGIIRAILVREGQIVEKNAPLAQLDNELAESSYRDAINRSQEHQVALVRLEAELAGVTPEFPTELQTQNGHLVADQLATYEARLSQRKAELDVLESQAQQRQRDVEELISRKRQLDRSLGIALEQRSIAYPLMQRKNYSRVEFLGLEQKVVQLQGDVEGLAATIPRAQAAEKEANQRISFRKAEIDAAITEEINKRRNELASLKESIAAGSDRVTRTELRSPVRGTVKQIYVHTVGGVVKPGESIMEVVPLDDSLLVEARVRPADVAFLHPGQKAMVKISAYDFSVYGGLEATLEHISADTIEDKRGDFFYQVRLRTKKKSIIYQNEELPIIPGMMATVDILTGKKTVLDYILKPILKARQNALRER